MLAIRCSVLFWAANFSCCSSKVFSASVKALYLGNPSDIARSTLSNAPASSLWAFSSNLATSKAASRVSLLADVNLPFLSVVLFKLSKALVNSL